MHKFKTIAKTLRGQGKDEAIEKLLTEHAREGFALVAFTAEPAHVYRFIFSKSEAEKSGK
jgi:hypothetical protein